MPDRFVEVSTSNAQLDRPEGGRNRWPKTVRWQSIVVIVLLVTHAGLLGYSATCHSPTYLEPAFLASGICHWELDRFEPYRVNPPLVRMVAALPVIASGYHRDWSSFYDRPGSRVEFPLGDDFIRANGPSSILAFHYARWACIPFNLIGSFFAYRWAKELYGSSAGFVAMVLYVFEPNLLAHGELITSDGACTAFGILAGYTFWRWLKQPDWKRAILAGSALGLAELTKLSWIILFGLWPLLWCVWRLLGPNKQLAGTVSNERHESRDATAPGMPDNSASAIPLSDSALSSDKQPPSVLQLSAILLVATYIINIGYGFDGFGTRVNDFRFVSTMLTGSDDRIPANRFGHSWFGSLPVPLPQQYVLGIDCQRRDFEGFHEMSYLRGEWKKGGWWYYYVYGLLVKVPCATWCLFAIVIGFRLLRHPLPVSVSLRDELILVSPAIALFVIVSSHTEFNIHLRYVYPALGLILIFLGQSAIYMLKSRVGTIALSALGAYLIASVMLVYPNHLAYFNDFVGGPANGHRHILGSSLDWGQGLNEAINWIKENEPSTRVEFAMWPTPVAKTLFNQPSDPQVRADLDFRRANLVLYSADYFSRKQHKMNHTLQQKNPSEEVVKRFKSGMVLLRVTESN